MKALLPCPFCAAELEVSQDHRGAMAWNHDCFDIAAWNHRAPATLPDADGLEVVNRLQEAYDKVAEWPEKRMPGVDVSTLGEGFTDLLRLRNLAPGIITALQSRDETIASLERERGEAHSYLREFMTIFVKEHFPENTGWRPLPDLIGMLTQMDNVSTVARDYVLEIASLKARLSRAMEVVRPFAALGDAILSEAPADADRAVLFTSSDGEVHTVLLDQFRAAREFLEGGE